MLLFSFHFFFLLSCFAAHTEWPQLDKCKTAKGNNKKPVQDFILVSSLRFHSCWKSYALFSCKRSYGGDISFYFRITAMREWVNEMKEKKEIHKLKLVLIQEIIARISIAQFLALFTFIFFFYFSPFDWSDGRSFYFALFRLGKIQIWLKFDEKHVIRSFYEPIILLSDNTLLIVCSAREFNINFVRGPSLSCCFVGLSLLSTYLRGCQTKVVRWSQRVERKGKKNSDQPTTTMATKILNGKKGNGRTTWYFGALGTFTVIRTRARCLIQAVLQVTSIIFFSRTLCARWASAPFT